LAENQLLKIARALPKIELHRHLEGSVRLTTLIDIAQQYGIEMPEYDIETLRPFVQMMPGEPRNSQHFLAKFYTLRQFFRSPEVIQRVAQEVIIDAAADNIRYLELRFTPPALSNLMGCSYHDVIAWVCETASATATQSNIDVRFIISVNRHESVEIASKVLDTTLEMLDYPIVAFDLAGSESTHPALPFQPVFQRAYEAGLGVTIHAGEWASAENIRSAVEDFRAHRIGHGVRAIDDPNVIEILLERQVVLEVCPTSNIHSGVIPDWSEHPLPRLYRQGVRTTINTDDPLVSNITLSDELACVVETMSLTIDDMKQHLLTAAGATFLPPDERAALVNKFENWLKDTP
jgi:adenosine deaminase